jgi:hypothetical protein
LGPIQAEYNASTLEPLSTVISVKIGFAGAGLREKQTSVAESLSVAVFKRYQDRILISADRTLIEKSIVIATNYRFHGDPCFSEFVSLKI